MNPAGHRHLLLVGGVALLLAIMASELALSARRQSQTFDEASHIFAGYRYWKSFDFGINPEHPPLVKLVATLPLLRLPLRVPEVPGGDFKLVEYTTGRDFLYRNNADALLWRSRMAAALFTIGLGLVIFFFANSMAGRGTAFLALVLFVFEPNFLANGALVTTDVGATLGLFLGVAAFYWYLQKPSPPRLFGAGLAAGISLGAKHSGILLFPMLLCLAFTELAPFRDPVTRKLHAGLARNALRQVASLTVIAAIAVAVLWSLYGFRFAARPAGASLHPTLTQYISRTGPDSSAVVRTFARWHLFPEAYLYGLADIYTPAVTPTVIFGKYYPASQWFYFPAVFIIKSTLAFLALGCLAPFAFAHWRKPFRRELLFLLIPPALYFLVAMISRVNYGVRHLLPVYPFLIVLIACGAWHVRSRHRALGALVAILLVFHAASTLHAFPDYIPYSNELWGGPVNTYKVLADSNVDWGQGLKQMKQYVDQRHIQDCWFAYFGSVTVDVSYYGIPCKPLPTGFTDLLQIPMPVVPPQVDAPVFISSTEISGMYWGEPWANPYLAFRRTPPSALIAGSILVYDGKVDTSSVSALTHEYAAVDRLNEQKLNEALVEAETAVKIAPNRPSAHAARSAVLSAMGRSSEAGKETMKAQLMESEILAAQ